MQVFISWSGEQSKKLADAIRAWLQPVLQSVEPYFSHVDIDTGARWYSELVEALEKSNVGLIILTQENLNNPWIMFFPTSSSTRC
jgi:TIR domain